MAANQNFLSKRVMLFNLLHSPKHTNQLNKVTVKTVLDFVGFRNSKHVKPTKFVYKIYLVSTLFVFYCQPGFCFKLGFSTSSLKGIG